MGKLQFITRGMSNPKGKQKVYFSCHPEDFELYFDVVTKDILDRQDCAIWYWDKSEAESEEMPVEEIKEMQLVVMPVTTNLLLEESHAMDIEYVYATEHHIPILPLMMESGLEEFYEKKFGKRQYLSKENQDTTAISYEEKLDKYLKSVLIGDELAEKIRGAFDAYVFLSYRKKDRAYAKELMSLIHKNEFCRDIAIWYDEYLTPGEDFSESIQSALKKSDLFVMAITPNLVNEVNYIVTTEYPLAKKEGKPIFPAELVPTDKKLLQAFFYEIPDCTDAHDEEKLSEALLKQVKALAIRENDNSPEHNFFIGLAYLSGVDVEVNFERAVALITDAAEAGLIEAVEKLVDMYYNGNGVEYSIENAIFWQKNAIELYQEKYQKERTCENLLNWVKALINCAQFYSDAFLSTEAEACLLEGTTLLEGAPDFIEEPEYIHTLGALYYRRANNQFAQGQTEKAIEFCRQGLVIYELAKEKTSFVKKQIADGNRLMADYYFQSGDLQECECLTDKALQILLELEKEQSDPDLRLRIAECHYLKGTSCHWRREYQEAIVQHYKEVEYYQANVNESPSKENKINLLCGYVRLLRFYDVKELSADEEETCCRKCMELAEAICKENDDYYTKAVVSNAYIMIGRRYNHVGRKNEALEHYEKAESLLLPLYEKTQDFSLGQQLASLYAALGEFYKYGNKSKAIEYYEKDINVRMKIAQNSSFYINMDNLVGAYVWLGDVYKDKHDDFMAYLSYAKARKVNRQILQNPNLNNPESYKTEKNIQERIKEVSGGPWWFKKVNAYYETHLDMCEKIARDTDSFETWITLMDAHKKMADLYGIQKLIMEKNEHIEEAEDIQRMLEKKMGEKEGTGC